MAGEQHDLKLLGGFVENGADAGEIIVSADALLLRLSVLSYNGHAQRIGREIGAVWPAKDAKLIDACLCEECWVFERFEDRAE